MALSGFAQGENSVIRWKNISDADRLACEYPYEKFGRASGQRDAQGKSIRDEWNSGCRCLRLWQACVIPFAQKLLHAVRFPQELISDYSYSRGGGAELFSNYSYSRGRGTELFSNSGYSRGHSRGRGTERP